MYKMDVNPKGNLSLCFQTFTGAHKICSLYKFRKTKKHLLMYT